MDLGNMSILSYGVFLAKFDIGRKIQVQFMQTDFTFDTALESWNTEFEHWRNI